MRVRLGGRHGVGYFVLIQLVLFTRRACIETLIKACYSLIVALVGVLMLYVFSVHFSFVIFFMFFVVSAFHCFAQSRFSISFTYSIYVLLPPWVRRGGERGWGGMGCVGSAARALPPVGLMGDVVFAALPTQIHLLHQVSPPPPSPPPARGCCRNSSLLVPFCLGWKP